MCFFSDILFVKILVTFINFPIPYFLAKKSGKISFLEHRHVDLKVQSCKLHNNKYTIISTQITNTEICAFIAILVFKLLIRKVLFINRKDNRNC